MIDWITLLAIGLFVFQGLSEKWALEKPSTGETSARRRNRHIADCGLNSDRYTTARDHNEQNDHESIDVTLTEAEAVAATNEVDSVDLEFASDISDQAMTARVTRETGTAT